MFPKTRYDNKGQALVEFALVIGILLLIFFIIIEGGRLFQAWLTVQNAARSAGRYALTGQYDETGAFTTPECPAGTPVNRWRVCSVKEQAFQAASGLNIDTGAGPTMPGAFGTQVCQPGNCPPEATGMPGEATRVTVFYNSELITPFLRPFAKFIRVVGQIEVVMAQYDQVSPGDIIIADVSGGVGGPAVPNEADLEITKTGPSNAKTMEVVNYALTVRNLGEFGTPTVEILDLLPNETISMTNYAISSGGVPIDLATCSFSRPDQQVACTIPYLDYEEGNPGSALIDLELLIAPPELDEVPYPTEIDVTNTATVFNQIATIDPNETNNVFSATTTISRWYELDVTKEIAPYQTLPINLGDTVDYVITVKNLGPNRSLNATLTDSVTEDEDLGFTSILAATAATDSGSIDFLGDCNISGGNDIVCALPSLASQETAEIWIQGIVKRDDEDVTNTATVSWDFPSGSDSATISFNPTSPILEISKTVVPINVPSADDPVLYSDERATYTVKVTNSGDGIAKQVILTDLMQSLDGVQFTQPPIVVFESPVDPPPACEYKDSGTFVCDALDIGSGEILSLGVPVVPFFLDQYQLKGTLVNGVSVSSNSGFYGATGGLSADIRRRFDLQVSKTTDESELDEGKLLYTVSVYNEGPSTSPPFTVKDSLSLALNSSNVSATVDDFDTKYISNCASDANGVNCNVGSLPAGITTWFTLRVDLTNFVGTIGNTASVDVEGDFRDSNDSVTTPTIVYRYALEISKSGPPPDEPVNAGDPVEYVVEVTNRGALPADFSVSDIVETRPLDLISGISVTSAGATCSGSPIGLEFDCEVQGLAPGETASIVATMTPQSGGFLTNTATIFEAPYNVPAYPDSASVNTTVRPMADLGLALSLTSALSETFQFQVDVTNDGPSVAAAPQVTGTFDVVSGTILTATVTLDPGLVGSCDSIVAGSGTAVSWSCDIPNLGNAETASLSVEISFADESDNEFSSQASVQSDTYDPGPNANGATFDWP